MFVLLLNNYGTLCLGIVCRNIRGSGRRALASVESGENHKWRTGTYLYGSYSAVVINMMTDLLPSKKSDGRICPNLVVFCNFS